MIIIKYNYKNNNKTMEIDKIIQYILIGNVVTGKIIYEMQNTNDFNIIYEIKQLFKTYSLKHNLKQENIKVESYYINISLDKLIMISKTNVSFSIEQNLELFEKIKRNAPEIINYPLKTKKKNEKQNLASKITNIIFDYFQYINANKQIISESYFKFKPKVILNESNKTIVNKEINKIITSGNNNNSINKSSSRKIFKNKMNDVNNIYNQNKNKKRKSLIDVDDKKNKAKELVLNQKKEEEDENSVNSNIIKSLYQSRVMFKINESNNIINPELLSINSMKFNRNNSKNKKIVILIFLIIILIQIVFIPLIIINSYSY